MLKKIFAILFIILSAILGLLFILQIPITINNMSSTDIAYSAGYVIGSLLFLILPIFLFRLGLKWLKPKPIQIETIDDIGKS